MAAMSRQVPSSNDSSQLQQNTATVGERLTAESNTDIAETTTAEGTTADIAGSHRAASSSADSDTADRDSSSGYHEASSSSSNVLSENWRSRNMTNPAAISSALPLLSPCPNNINHHLNQQSNLPLPDNNRHQQTDGSILRFSSVESNSDRTRSEIVTGHLKIPKMNNGEHVISPPALRQMSAPARMEM